MKKIKVGFIGLGQRGAGVHVGEGAGPSENYGLIGTCMLFDDVEITAVCDLFQDRVERAKKILASKGYAEPFGTTDVNTLLKQDIDVVIISAAWEAHVPLAIASMKAGVRTALEVGGAYTVQDCYDLVEAYEQTKTPFMFLENCCYGEEELLVTNMVRKGVLGEILHCHGAYCHDLRPQIAMGLFSNHYRLRNYLTRNCDNYPTHNLGPIAKLLNINRGNKMLYLSSMASKSKGMSEYVSDKQEYKELHDKVFAQGDVVHTSITCQDGSLITLKLATTLPRAYSREFNVNGTKGYYTEIGKVLYTEKVEGKTEGTINDFLNTYDKYKEKFLPQIWKNVTQEEIQSGHGGMDVFMLRDMFNCIKENREFPIDVYDAACWMAITVLSEQSIKNNGASIEVPDFTKGKWNDRPNLDVIDFSKE